MKELVQMLGEAARLRQEGRPFALATVVKIEGSAYRRPGARMLATAGGRPIGFISGGCLEGEVAQQAGRVLNEGRPLRLTFEVDEDDPFLGFGSGCGGTVHVLVERVEPGDATDPLSLLAGCLAQRRTGVLATAFETPSPEGLGTHLLVTEDDETSGARLPDALHGLVLQDAAQTLVEGKPVIRQYGLPEGRAEVLFEVVRPPVRLAVFGNGFDVAPVVRLGRELGWEVVVVGRKPQETLAAHFPEADRHVFLMHPEAVREAVALDARSAALVMNHNYLRDQALLAALLQTPAGYVGMLGPGRRTTRMLEELRAEGLTLDAEQQARLRTPVGLDIGTETPEEIALSIVAEIQAVLHGRSGGPLSARSGPIHRPVEVT